MKSQKIIIAVICLLLLSSVINAQKKIKHKFGKLNPGEIEMKYYEQDSSASAVILYDKGHSYFEYDNNKKGFRIAFKRSMRVKILKKDAFGYADFEIPLYVGSYDVEEEVMSLKGRTFNLEKDKVVSTKVNKSSIFYDNKSKHLKIAKISFPDVKEGSVIDIEYKVFSDFMFNLRGWQFQYEIPVVYSEYSVVIPEYFKYNIKQKGYDNVVLNEKEENMNETFLVDYKTGPEQGGKVESGTVEYNSHSSLFTWTALNIPAFIEEPYITTSKNYLTALDFELKSISYPGQPTVYYTNSWNDVNKMLMNNTYFGQQLKPTKKIKLKAEEICSGAETKLAELQAIYSYIIKNIKWNGYNSRYINNKLKDVLDNKTGNSADINMLLLNMLKSREITAKPVVLSTRSNGMIFPTHPTLSSFNYVIVQVTIDGKKYLIDATDNNIPLGILPKRCLNGTGRIVGTPNFDEIKIVPAQKYSASFLYTLSINPDENLSGTVNKTYKGYAAAEKRDNIKKTGEKEYITKFIENTDDAEIVEVSYTKLNKISKPLKENYKITTSANVTFAGNLIYLTPLLNERIKDNPFKLDERKYPVDYAFPYIEKLIFQYTVPEGYKLSEKPENTAFSLPGRAAQFQYQVSEAGNIVQIISIFKINKPLFQYDSYKPLKNFYDLVIKKQNEKIIFEKS